MWNEAPWQAYKQGEKQALQNGVPMPEKVGLNGPQPSGIPVRHLNVAFGGGDLLS